MKTVHVLTILPAILPSEIKTKGGSKLLLELFEANTLLKDTIPYPNDPPRLIAVGKPSKPDLCLTCYIDSTPLFAANGVRALLLLIASYCVFDIQFCPEARPSFLFLFAALLREKFKSSFLLKTPIVTGLLKQLKL